MTQRTRWRINEAEAVLERFKFLGNDMRRRGGRFALRKGANAIRDDAKRRALLFDDPATGRIIANNIAVRWDGRYFRATGNLKFRIGVLGRGFFINGNPDEGISGPTPHWRLLEFGTSKMRPQPFLRPAGEENAQLVTSLFITHYQRAMERALLRVRRR